MKKYLVKEYIELLQKEDLIKEIIDCNDILEKEVNYVSYNSKEVIEDTLFVCKGASFQEKYLKEAIQAGVFIYVSEKPLEVLIPGIIVTDVKLALSRIACLFFNHPGKDLNIIGITGTKGKTTTAYFLKAILDEYASNTHKKDTAIISTIDTYDGKEHFESHITTPESYDLQRHFYNAKMSGIKNLVMEVSSQGLKYNRTADVFFTIGAFLNISEDHISPIEHPNFEDYFSSKLKLFERTKNAIVNLDDPLGEKIYQKALENAQKVYTISLKNQDADFYAYDIKKVGEDTIFKVQFQNEDVEFLLTVPGIFNVENALVAIASAYILNVPVGYIVEGLKKAKSKGRMELYSSLDKKIMVLVDYAHNRLSFERVFHSMKEEYPDRYKVVVFGSVGGKAQMRRKDLGEIAGQNADKIYITADDPATERVEDISNEIEKYVKKYNQNCEKIEDREQAIKSAIIHAASQKENVMVLLLGKGNDQTQKVGKEYVPYETDSFLAKKYLKAYDDKKLKDA